MGKPVNRSPDRDESPFVDREVEKRAPSETVRNLIASGESDTVEFKSTGRINLHTGRKDPAIEWSIAKSVAAFMNAQGGELLIGVDDAGQPVGIERDFPLVKSHNRDGWELWLGNLFSSTLGKVEAAGVTARYCEFDGRTDRCLHQGQPSVRARVRYTHKVSYPWKHRPGGEQALLHANGQRNPKTSRERPAQIHQGTLAVVTGRSSGPL